MDKSSMCQEEYSQEKFQVFIKQQQEHIETLGNLAKELSTDGEEVTLKQLKTINKNNLNIREIEYKEKRQRLRSLDGNKKGLQNYLLQAYNGHSNESRSMTKHSFQITSFESNSKKVTQMMQGKQAPSTAPAGKRIKNQQPQLPLFGPASPKMSIGLQDQGSPDIKVQELNKNQSFGQRYMPFSQKQTSIFASERSSRIQNLGKHVEQLRIKNGKRQIKSFIEAQMQNGYQRYKYQKDANYLATETEQSKMYDQLDVPLDLSSQYQSEIKSKEIHIGQMIDSIKLQEFQNQAKQGMSVFYQDTFANFFKVPSTTKAGKIQTLLSHLEINEKELDKIRPAQVPIIDPDLPKSNILPKVRKSKNECFRREMKNSQLKNAHNYLSENHQFRELSIKSKTRNSLQNNFASLLGASQPARVYTQRNSTVGGPEDKQSFPIAQCPVSTRMIDLDDIVNNKQFLKNSLKTEKLAEKYQKMLQKRKDELDQQQKPGSVFDVVLESSQLPTAKYHFRQNGHLDASKKKDLVLKQFIGHKLHEHQKRISPKNQELAEEDQLDQDNQSEDERTPTQKMSNWKKENDDKFLIDKYIIRVQKSPSKVLGLKGHFDNLVDQKQFIKEVIDASIQAKKKDPTFGGAISGISIKYAAKELYQVITERDPEKDPGYKTYLLNVFKFFPEDPLQNSDVQCNIKGIVKKAVRGEQYQKGDMCSHRYEDDIHLKNRYKVQLWFLNFYKYVTLLIMNRDGEEQAKINKIQATITLKQTTKKSRRGDALKKILKNLEEFLQDFPEDRKTELGDPLSVTSLLNDPILKLIVLERPQEVIDYKCHIQEEDQNKEFFVNQLANMVLEKFQDQVIKIKKRKYVTFKNKGDCLFNHKEEKSILDKFDSVMPPRQQTPEPVSPKLEGRGSPPMTERRETVVEEMGILSRPDFVEGWPLTKHDLIKQVMNLMVQDGHKAVVREYDIMSKIQNKISTQFNDFKKRQLEKKSKNKRKQTLDPEKVDYDHLTEEMPIMLKISLYHNFKKIAPVVSIPLHDKENASFQFYNKAKQLMEGNQKLDDEDIQYFKSNRSQDIAPMPLLFKHVSNNEICFDGLFIDMGQIISIRNTLIQAAQHKVQSKQILKDNPFLIRTLIIKDCGMSDDSFATILEGIEAQRHIKNIHYIGNEIGPKSAATLARIVSREKSDEQVHELNLSNLKLQQSGPKEDDKLLIQILRDCEYKLLRLKLSHVDLNNPKTMKELIEILHSNYGIMTYLNLSHSNIQLPDLINITSECISFSKLDYLSLSGNKITQNCLGPRRPQFKSTRKLEPEQVFQEMMKELTDNICEIIVNPQSCLRYLDISEIQFGENHLRQICKAITRNHLLESVNLGSFLGDESLKEMCMHLLGIKHTTTQMNMHEDLTTIEKEISYKEVYQKTGLWKKVKEEKSFRNSLLLENSSTIINPQAQLILNRTSRNPELVFNAQSIEFDPFLNQKWFPVKECFVCERYRYTQIYYNIQKPEGSDFYRVENQEKLLRTLDKHYSPGLSPLIIINGQVHQMINPSIYACLLSLSKMQAEITKRLQNPTATAELTGCTLNNVEQKKIQEKIAKELQAVTELQMQEILCEIAQEQITLHDLDKLSDHQLKILRNFHLMSWERIIDEEAINENMKYITKINSQEFDYNEALVHTIDELLIQRKPMPTQSSIAGPPDDKDREIISVTPTPDICNIVMPNNLSLDEQKEYKFLLQINFIFAGYLPPGKNQVYIYDRHNKILLGREMYLDFTNGYAGEVNPTDTLDVNRTVAGPTFTFKPPDPSPESEPEDQEQII